MKVLFTNHLPQRVGTLCQAIQPAKFINDIKDISAQYIPEQRLTNNMNFDIIVFAKQCNPNVLRWAKEKGMTYTSLFGWCKSAIQVLNGQYIQYSWKVL